MKTILKGVVPGLILFFLLAGPVRGEGKLATIDLRKVFDNYWKREQAEAALKARGSALEKDFKSMVDDGKKVQEEYNKLLAAADDQSVTPDERDKRKNLAAAKLAELRSIESSLKQADDNNHKQMSMQSSRMRETLLQDIRAAVNAKAKAGGYALVIDSAALTVQQTPTLIYTDGQNDLTDAILAQLNAAAPSTPPDAAKSPDKKSGAGAKK